MTSRISFIPAATETLPVPGAGSSVIALPAVDSGNPDVTVSHSSSQPVILAFGAGAIVGPNSAGAITVLPGQTILLTSNAAVLAAATNALVQGGPQAAAAGTQTAVTVWTPSTVQLTLTRGTASAVQSF